MFNKIVNYLIKNKRIPTYKEIRNHFTRFQTTMPLPLFGQIEITTKCNFDCVYCNRTALDLDNIDKNMSFNKIKKIIDETNFQKLTFQGFGEPLLNKDIGKMLEYSKNKGIETRVVSNGSIVPSLDVLKCLDILTISFDTTDEKIFNTQRVGANYQKILKNIDKIIVLKDKGEINTRLELNVVITHLNYNEIYKIAELSKKLRISKITYNEVLNMSLNSEKEFKESQVFVSKTRELRDKIYLEIDKVKEDFKEIEVSEPMSRLNYKNSEFKGKCPWPFKGSFITINGYLTPCCVIMDPSIKKFGNIFENNFKDVWNGDKLKSFRIQNLEKIENICDKCPYIS